MIMVKRWLVALGARFKQQTPTRSEHDYLLPETQRELPRAVGLFDRYQRTGDLGALNDAVTLSRGALLSIPTNHPYSNAAKLGSDPRTWPDVRVAS